MIQKKIAFLKVAPTVCQLTKLRMLEFCYDIMNMYINRKVFELIQMDMGNLWMTLSDLNSSKHDKKLWDYSNKSKSIESQWVVVNVSSIYN